MIEIIVYGAILTFVVVAVFIVQSKTDTQIYTSAGSGLAVFDKNKQLDYSNDTAQKYLPFLKKSWGNRVDLPKVLSYFYDHAVELDQGLKEVLHSLLSDNDDGEDGFREVIRTEDGRLCFIELHEQDEGTFLITLRDVTKLKEREDHILDLHQHNYELLNAIEASPAGIMICDVTQENTPIVYANQTFCDLLDVTKDLMTGKDWRFIEGAFSGGANNEQDEFWQGAFIDLESVDAEFSKQTKDGDKWVHIKLTPVLDSQSGRGFVVGVFTDITHAKIRDHEFAQAKKLESLGRLAAGIAHDFNNVLSVVDGFARLTSQGLPETEQRARNNLDRIRQAVERGGGLTRQMRAFGKHKMMKMEVHDLRDIVREEHKLLELSAGERIALDVNLPEQKVFVSCDAPAMSQIVMNLCLNARDAMPEGGALNIDLSIRAAKKVKAYTEDNLEAAEYACIAVTDTGEGMDIDTKHRVFEPFFSTKDKDKGTGLGLSIVYGLVQEMKGFIHVDSTKGKGTTMSVFLPLSEEQPQSASDIEAPDINKLKLDGYTALVAEDEPDLLELIAEILETMGMKVLKASNGNEALLLQDEHKEPIDLLVTDVVMPGLDGVKLADLFIAAEPEAKIVFMSGYPGNEQIQDIELPPDKPFLAKPIRHEVLTRCVHQQIQQKAT